MPTEPNLDPKASLLLIESMIARARNKMTENGHLYLLWGWTIFACSIFHFVAIYFRLFERPEWIWGLTWAALIYQFIYLARQKKREKVRSYADEISGYVWITFVIMMFLTGIILSTNKDWPSMYPMFLVLYGMPTFLSGVVLRFQSLKLGGFACWVLAILALFLDWPFQLLLLSAAVILAWIVPGYLLRWKHKTESND